MKNINVLFLLFFSLSATAQFEITNKDIPILTQARIYLNQKSVLYNPKKAIDIFTTEAEKGNAQAMNALGVIYSRGTGTDVNSVQAVNWFEKAGQNKYPNAWFNLGLIYKNGIDVPQDFTKAVDCFTKGSLLNSSSCTYSLGYMKFKGLGCKQSYEEAVPLFRKSILLGSLGSMYMLGICFRNGYGIALNTDSAKYWIERSASKGYAFATDELQEAEPENSMAINNQSSKSQTGKAGPDKSAEFQQLKHKIDTGKFYGTYTGYLIRYDWSGKNVIGKSKLTLRLNGENKSLTGEWIEDDKLSTGIQAELTDTALIFNNTSYERIDHYSAKKPAAFEFRDARLSVVKTKDSIYLAGTIQQFSLRQNEPEKPMYINLTQELEVQRPERVKTDSLTLASSPDKESSVLISDIIAFPNPFDQSFQLSFKLKAAQKVTIYVADLMGRQIYMQRPQLAAGEQNLVINTNAPKGTYVLKVQYGKEVHSTVLIKQ